jgi:hypothetical protein
MHSIAPAAYTVLVIHSLLIISRFEKHEAQIEINLLTNAIASGSFPYRDIVAQSGTCFAVLYNNQA